jgi:DNA topoisomerase-1
VKALEEKGIGRPSTYAPTISTIQDRGYVIREGQAFKPTDLGRKVNTLLVGKFSDIIDEGFTARMEDNLDSIQSGEKDWVSTVREFYEPFLQDLRKALGMTCPKCGGDIAIRNGRYGAFFACTRYPDCDWRASISPRETSDESQKLDETCPQCGKSLLVKHGRYGKFVACTGFPDCKYTRSYEEESETGAPEGVSENEEGARQKREITYSNTKCPKCGNRMVLRRSKAGRFWGCEKYPECNGLLPYTVGVKCTRPGCEGEFVERRTRKGKIFYGCSKYPECTETSWTYPGKREKTEGEKTRNDSDATMKPENPDNDRGEASGNE